MILVTGATGHLGGLAIEFLLKKVPANQIAALARTPEKAADLAAKGVEIRQGDYHDYASLVAAFRGVDKLLLVSSSDFNDRAGQQINAINAAKEAGVKHIVYTSVAANKNVSSQSVKLITDSHLATDAHLKASGVAYTLLNNTLYADVLPMFVGEKVAETGVFFPAGNGRVAYATRENMAEAAANVLAGTGHENKEYDITGLEALSYGDVAALLSEIFGKTISYTDAPLEVYVDVLKGAGVPDVFVEMLSGFATAIKKDELDVVSSDLENLLGKKPTTVADYLRGVYGAK
ncbi:NAD(P)H dehydrogenase (quinone) [Flexibacter flexilis DSM 6793]|uniref:NAD(P)H dehydrogenase (Quinone) n=1 Tax=Flexibacter flexilis DSM 6793 TaxID=927664 RepID=A0A1I1K0V3_9BACT|nr:SDR family oxidoreductase [Flexibacter flexilis]SFC53842.1 NAD(P)H dehydrogenase (quinone) [Flexibacter flexilis DSM 6793]